MRKILTLLAVCMLSIGAWAAADKNYVMTEVNTFAVTNQSTATTPKYLLTFGAKGTNSGTTYTYEIKMTIYPETEDFVGAFSTQNGSLSKVKNDNFVKWIPKTGSTTSRYLLADSVSYFTITHVSGTTYQFSGRLCARKASGESNTMNYNFSTPLNFTYDPFADEPEQSASAIDFTTSNISLSSEEDATPLVFRLGDNYVYSDLQFNVASYELPAGNYPVAASGNNTLQASVGACGRDPFASIYTDYSGWDPLNYYFAGGSVDVSYNDKTDSIFMAGAVTTAHGSTINIDAKGKNPFYVPEPETVDLTVSQVNVSKGNGYFDLALTATPNNFMIDLSVSALAGASISDVDASYTYANFGSYDYSYMDASKTSVNALSIVATGNTDEYKLNATIACENGNTYVMTDVVFEYETPNAWTEEPKGVNDFTVTATSGTEQFVSSKGYMLFTFSTSAYDEARIAIAATSEAAPAAGVHNVVNDSPAAGDVVGSAGKVSSTRNPSLVYMYTPNNWFYIRGGSVTIAYSQDNQKLMMTGDVTTYRGTTITLDLTMDNPFLPKEKTLDVQSISASITATGMDFDIVTTSQFDPAEVMLSLVGTQANKLPIIGMFDYSKFDSWYSYADAKDSYYPGFETGSSVTITSAAEGCVMNGTLLCENGWTYFLEDAAFKYAMAVSDQASPVALLTRAMDATVDLTVQRTLYCDGGWNTICLPFDWTITSDESNPLAGATVAKYVSASKVGEEYVLVFDPTTSLTAGQPYLIRWADGSDIENPVFKNVTIKATEGATVQDGNVAFKGILEPTELVGEDKRFITTGDTLSYATTAGNLKGFRAYFETSVAPGVAMRFVVRGAATNLKQADSEQPMPSKMIKNGQLIILRDNKMFNAQGARL